MLISSEIEGFVGVRKSITVFFSNLTELFRELFLELKYSLFSRDLGAVLLLFLNSSASATNYLCIVDS